jgi:hypothetical protein
MIHSFDLKRLWTRSCRVGAALAVPFVLIACGDDGGTLYDLTIIETVPVEFGSMEPDIAEGAVVELGDLNTEPAYVEAREALRCATIDMNNSSILVEALDVGQFATPLVYNLGVAARGSKSFQPLATFSGPIAEGQRIRFADSGFQVVPAGVDFVARTLLSNTPALDLEVRGQVPTRIDDLVVKLTLTLKFSSTASDCN